MILLILLTFIKEITNVSNNNLAGILNLKVWMQWFNLWIYY